MNHFLAISDLSSGEVQDLLKQSIAASRSLATELSPPVLNEAGLAAALEQAGWDVVLSDCSMPGFSGLEALNLVRAADETEARQLGEDALRDLDPELMRKTTIRTVRPASEDEIEFWKCHQDMLARERDQQTDNS